jgi:hypothetical protein
MFRFMILSNPVTGTFAGLIAIGAPAFRMREMQEKYMGESPPYHQDHKADLKRELACV